MEDETFERRGSCIFSSIGSIPEAIAGIDMKGELFDFSDWDIGRLDAYPTVFSVGNVVTGKGNIVASRKHAARVSEAAIERFLGIGEGHAGEEDVLEVVSEITEKQAEEVAAAVSGGPGVSAETLKNILECVAERQASVGYESDLAGWLEKAFPPAPS